MDKNKQEPDFRELNDRVIAEAPTGPFLTIKTNLDPKDSLAENPYVNKKTTASEKEEIQDFFD